MKNAYFEAFHYFFKFSPQLQPIHLDANWQWNPRMFEKLGEQLRYLDLRGTSVTPSIVTNLSIHFARI